MMISRLLLLFSFALVLCLPAYRLLHRTIDFHIPGLPKSRIATLTAKAGALKKYCHERNLHPTVCFMIDMSQASGSRRFYIYDLGRDTILDAGLVAHGSCDNGFRESAVFSNKVNSGCSCRGRFRVGGSYQGRFGLAYKLFGLDSSNSNAFERNIVLHSYSCVPESETYPVPICNSRGCAMVSPGFMEKIKKIMDASRQPVLLWIW